MIEQSRAAAGDLEDSVGPFYSAAKLRAWLGIDQHALDTLVRARSILALSARDDAVFYPAWQWRTDGHTGPGNPVTAKTPGKHLCNRAAA